ncbi:MAG: chloride channel protein [Bacteroidaceae bacterium]|nr:chloride channel protein [Bacteroidaceae bacterium]
MKERVETLIRWQREHLRGSRFMLVLAFIVGVLTALAGLLLKAFIHQVEHMLTNHFSITDANWPYLVYPVVGIFLTGLFVRYIVRDDIGHGITKILYAIARKKSRIKGHNTWTSIVASGITIGFGGSVGAEAPIVLTGSAIGSNLGQFFHLDSRKMMLLVGCGAAGAVSGIFKAPIAGLVFTLEVLMIDFTLGSLLPLLVSCVTAAAVTFAISGTDNLFEFHLVNAFAIERVPAYILLGIFCGFISLYFTRVMNWLEDQFRRLGSPLQRFLIAAPILSVLIFLFPSLYGEGYSMIRLLLNGQGPAEWNQVMEGSFFYGAPQLLLVYLAGIIIFKVFATTATNSGGGCGGTFAPSLFLGCVSGFLFASLWNLLSTLNLPLFEDLSVFNAVPENNFSLLGMAGLMSGVMHAPLTGIFLIAELTGGYGLFLPLMIVATCAYLTIIIFEPHSIYTMRLARKGQLVTHNKDQAILTLMSMDSVIERYEEHLHPSDDLSEIVRQISSSSRDIFPVVDDAGKLLAVLVLDRVRHVMFRTELYHKLFVRDLMSQCAGRLNVGDPMDVVVKTFDQTKAWTLPVVDEEGIFIGFIRRSHVFAMYRSMLQDMSEE